MFSTVFVIISILLIGGILVVIISTIFFKKDNIANENEEGTHISDDIFAGNEATNLVKAKKILLSSDYLQAIQLLRKGKYEDATEVLQKLIDSGIHTESLHRRAIDTYIEIKNYSAAEKLLVPFAQKYTWNANDYLNSGWIKYCLENNEDALIDYEKALELNSSNTYALHVRGCIYSSMGNYEQAIIDFTKFMELNKELDYVYNNRGYAYIFLGNYEQAIADFDKAIELNPKFAYAYNNRGFAKMKLGLLEEGLVDNAKSIELDDKNAYAYRNLGIYHLEKNELNEALQLFIKSKEMDKNIPLIDDLIDETNSKIDENQ